jgi:ring-1,2-phenylacetyl-CoA epoxidase subunit PaaC
LNQQSLIDYTLHLADNNLILAQRNSEWCGHGPVLEQDIAITNISLDLIGQARNFYQYAAQLINNSPPPLSTEWRGIKGEVTEDTLAFHRSERDFKNCLMVEQPNGDWGQTILRQFFYSAHQFYLYQQLQKINPASNRDEQLAAIAAKALKEVTYHVRWSSEWIIRLGDGTEESHQRVLNAIDVLKMYTGEFFITVDYEKEMGVDVKTIKNQWGKKIKEVFDEATLQLPGKVNNQTGGKKGNHSEHLSHILAEMQFLQKTYPGAEW